MEFAYIVITVIVIIITLVILWCIFVPGGGKKKLRSKKSSQEPKRLKESGKAYYTEDFDGTIGTMRMNRLSKSRKAKKGGAKYNYRERTYYKILFLGSDTDVAKPLRINEVFESPPPALRTGM